jgi:tubulin monoglycylase TTLL3/8
MGKIRQKMNEIIVKTFQACQESIEHRVNCFEIYGMDFILDYKLNPWLLEVNLSPACAERTEWLTDMLDCMTEGMLDAIEAKLLRIHDDFDHELQKGMKDRVASSNAVKRKYRWELIYDQKQANESEQLANREAASQTVMSQNI